MDGDFIFVWTAMFIGVIAFFGALVGMIVYKKRALPAWRGFLLGTFSGSILALCILALLSFIYLR